MSTPTITILERNGIARDSLGLLGMGLCALSCATEQWLGIGVGLAVLLVGLPTTSIVAFSIGQLGLIAAAPPVGPTFWGGQLGLLFVIAEPLRTLPAVDRRWQLGMTTVIGAAAITLAASVAVLRPIRLWLAGAAVIALVGAGVYTSHRYGTVKLGLVESTAPEADSSSD